MAENSRPPVAIRIVRPYGTEDELLEHELETVGKTSVILVGAHPRPTGVILRFEVALSSGAAVLRGEGRVLAHKENAFRGQAGLTLRFTRLDPKSKALVDRATAMREARAQEASPSRRPEAIAEALTASTPAPGMTAASDATALARSEQEAAVASALAAAREKANAAARENARRTGRGSSFAPPPVPSFDPPVPELASSIAAPAAPSPEPEQPSEPVAAPEPPQETAPEPPQETAVLAQPPRSSATPGAGAVLTGPGLVATAALAPPEDRAALLARLRARADGLPRERIDEILVSRARR